MSYCLGLYIDDNFIKYAKVMTQKDELPKVEAYGMVFYDNLDIAIEQIIKETYSYNLDIAVNINNESYNYFEAFAGLTKENLKKHLKLMFTQEICKEQDINPNLVEARFIKGEKKTNIDKIEIIYISVNKSDIAKRKQIFKGKLKKVLPVSVANLSLLDIDENTNAAILNIDGSSTLTIVLRGRIKKIININVGMSNILSKLNQKYNSYAKSYEKCKAITLLGENEENLITNQDSEDTEIITPLLYDLSQRISQNLKEYVGIVNKMYLTGTCVCINNIDLYIEEMLGDINVEILKPSFLQSNIEIANKIKDYTEVNSAIAVAIANTEVEDNNLNFIDSNVFMPVINKIRDNNTINGILNKIKPKNKEQSPKTNKKEKLFKESAAFSRVYNSSILENGTIILLIIFLGYVITTGCIQSQYKKKTEIIEENKNQIVKKITEIENDTQIINENIAKYTVIEQRLQQLTEKLDEIVGIKYDVPNLMTEIALVLPDEVILDRLTIVKNSVQIEVECTTYAPLGFFILKLKEEGILNNVSTQLVAPKDEIKGQKIIISGVIL